MHVYTSQKPYIKAVVYAMSDLDNQPNSTDVVSQEVWIESCNKCAPGPDDVGNELFKCLLFLAQSINAIVQHHITQEALDEGILVALPTSLIMGGGGGGGGHSKQHRTCFGNTPVTALGFLICVHHWQHQTVSIYSSTWTTASSY